MQDKTSQNQELPVQTNEVSIDSHGRVTLLDPDLLDVVSGGQGDTNNGCTVNNGCTTKPK